MSDQPGHETNAALSRLYREAARAEPPPVLDRAILGAAAAAVAGTQARRSAWWRRWRGPVAAFATIVLTVSLSVMMRDEQARTGSAVGGGVEAGLREAVTSAPTQTEKGLADQAAESRAAPTKARTQAPPPPGSFGVLEPKKEVAAQAAPSGASVSSANAPAALEPPPVSSPTGFKSNMLPRLPAAPSAPKPAAQTLDQAEIRPLRNNEYARDAMPAPAEEAGRGIAVTPSAEVWLARIREIKKQGKDQEAKAALEAFTRAFPDFRLPSDLK